MKLSAYRESLLSLTDQVLADYELQVLLQPTSTRSPYFGKELKTFAEQVFNSINSPQILTATSMGGTPIPGLTDLSTLPGKNQFNGDNVAPNLMPRSAVPFHATSASSATTRSLPVANPSRNHGEFNLSSGLSTKDLSRDQLLEILKTSLSTSEEYVTQKQAFPR